MIELRWLEKNRKIAGSVHSPTRIEVEKVLQYRMPLFSTREPFDPVSWTDWKDIPTVREDE